MRKQGYLSFVLYLFVDPCDFALLHRDVFFVGESARAVLHHTIAGDTRGVLHVTTLHTTGYYRTWTFYYCLNFSVLQNRVVLQYWLLY